MSREEVRSKILEILQGISPDVDFEHETKLIDDRILDSFSIIEALSQFMDTFGIEIDADDIEPENMNTLDAMTDLVCSRISGN